GQIALMIHCGSRGLGHQVATDYLRSFEGAMQKYGISVSDRQLACAPIKSPEGKDYYAAMAASVNFAFANRQVIMHRVRNVFSRVFGKDAQALGMHLVYDVAHNVAKTEEYSTTNHQPPTTNQLLVHRKGATRAFGPGNPALPKIYQDVGQPVILGGSMESDSYLLMGTKKAEEETFGSSAHGSGRTMSRSAAKKKVRGEKLQKEMESRGIYVKTASFAGLAEEAGLAYKDISEVVEALEISGISKPVVSFKPLGNIKG
ncbi:MAG: RtcB family protein, partial [Candidatus Cloacimonetes bacterium]|nr:RtcB family protein [Candidatus Cloacimonadota bacterium]